MIVMKVEANNLFAFKDFSLSLTYPKRIVNSTIEMEYLENSPRFRYKKLVTIMGANASGKTSIGRLLMSIFNFINKREISRILPYISNKEEKSTFLLDFLCDEKTLYRVTCEIIGENVELEVYKSKINKDDSYESCVEKFEKISLKDLEESNEKGNDLKNYIDKLKAIPNFGWLFTFPGDAESNCRLIKDDIGILDIQILKGILKTLDTSITDVEKSNEMKNSYIIRSKNGDVFVQNGKIINNSILSSGTKAGIDISYIISSMKKDNHGFYYCDERFTYIQSDVEQAILSLMIEILPKNSQLFFTTHNLDILELDLPIHSFIFLRKKDDIIEVIDPKDFIKKNDVSLRNAVKNDIFDIAPDINSIFELEGVEING